MSGAVQALIPALAAFASALAITPLVRAFARRIGAVAAPKADRWHSKPTAMMGGVAIFIAVQLTLLILVPLTRDVWVVMGASTALFLVGLIDDFVHLKPYQKLAGQLLGAAAVVSLGLVLPWTGSFALNTVITFFWLVGVTNAVNMLDNMDGLAAGVAAIAAFFLALNFGLNGHWGEAVTLGVFAAALAGFLVFNHNPASIFMGDCGSMFIGFFLASAALLSSSLGGRSRSVVAVLAVPVLVLFIPIFDTTFVTLARKLAGRAASQGGRDHTSHRLVALGLSERHAVWMLYAFASLAGVLALLVRGVDIDVSLAAIAGFAIVLSILGVYLATVRVYTEEELAVAKQKPVVALLLDLSHKRRIFEMLMDVLLIVLAYYLSHALLYGPVTDSPQWGFFLKTLPVVVFVQLAAFLVGGIYRGIWRYASLSDLAVFARGVTIAAVATVVTVFFTVRAVEMPRSALVLDAFLLMAFVTISRFAFRVLRRLMPAPHTRTGRRALILGAGDGGELLYRELHNNPALNYVAVGFIDDDERKAGKLLHGLRVHSGAESIVEVCQSHRAEALLLSTSKIPMTRLREIAAACSDARITLTRMTIELRPLTDMDLGWVLPSDDEGSFETSPVGANSPLLTVHGTKRLDAPAT